MPLALNVLTSISDLGIFVLAMLLAMLSSIKRFSFIFSFSTMVHILLARENGIFVKQCHGWFN